MFLIFFMGVSQLKCDSQCINRCLRLWFNIYDVICCRSCDNFFSSIFAIWLYICSKIVASKTWNSSKFIHLKCVLSFAPLNDICCCCMRAVCELTESSDKWSSACKCIHMANISRANVTFIRKHLSHFARMHFAHFKFVFVCLFAHKQTRHDTLLWMTNLLKFTCTFPNANRELLIWLVYFWASEPFAPKEHIPFFFCCHKI